MCGVRWHPALNYSNALLCKTAPPMCCTAWFIAPAACSCRASGLAWCCRAGSTVSPLPSITSITPCLAAGTTRCPPAKHAVVAGQRQAGVNSCRRTWSAPCTCAVPARLVGSMASMPPLHPIFPASNHDVHIWRLPQQPCWQAPHACMHVPKELICLTGCGGAPAGAAIPAAPAPHPALTASLIALLNLACLVLSHPPPVPVFPLCSLPRVPHSVPASLLHTPLTNSFPSSRRLCGLATLPALAAAACSSCNLIPATLGSLESRWTTVDGCNRQTPRPQSSQGCPSSCLQGGKGDGSH